MTNIEAMNKIFTNLQAKHTLAHELLSNTNEMEKMLKLSDIPSFGVLLGMRQGAMDKIDVLDRENQMLLDRLPIADKQKLEAILRPTGQTVTLENPLQTNIFDISKNIFLLMRRIVSQDELVNKIAKTMM